MAKRDTDVFDEFESSADRLADWVRQNAVWIGAAVLVAIAGSWGVQSWMQRSDTREEKASAALARARSSFLVAMGAGPSALEVPELANPDAAVQIEAEYLEQLGQVAQEYVGTVAATLAQLEAIEFEEDDLGPEATLAGLEALLATLSGSDSLRPIVTLRVAQTQEALGEFSAAAGSYEAAAEIRGYPLRDFARADAARCYAEAGEPDRALALYDQLAAESPDWRLPEHHRVLAGELRAGAGS